ncbi:PadR family transcriptional regulator [Hyphococcus flavus]|uniref:PadR family transcriptional regulator n=1 Tax=Hyphococcus flavus TaxID=1866326 RepID=A0AAF0CDZ1_9PROT|nr:PadR family transcriptional regulator [Hyphococcus flavus]WDI30431.1 PadR family transcriptional regulator [Hyphococcus flavus]
MARDLTNLENVALAHLWKVQPCTGHQLRLAFESSSAGRYSGSSGAIYPLLRRLESSGLIRSRVGANGEQQKKLYTITARGLAAAKRWLLKLEPKDAFADDPIKTRFQYIRLLDEKFQAEWFRLAIAALEEQDDMMRKEYAAEEYKNVVDQLVMTSVIKANRERRRWLRKAEEALAASDCAMT